MEGNLNTIEALAEFRIGELYRADHDAAHALVHLCRSHDLVSRTGNIGPAATSALFELHINVGKGKAFLECGAVKRALKWFLRAWQPLLRLSEVHPATNAGAELDAHLESMKHAPELDKYALQKVLPAAVNDICDTNLRGTQHHALAADILVRIAHVLLILRLDDNTTGRSLDAEKLLARAAVLDPNNLLVWSGLRRCEFARDG